MTLFLLFAATVFIVYFWNDYRIKQRDEQSASSPLRTGERFIGQVVTVPSGIAGGSGKIKLGQRSWALRGPNVPAGAKVRVTGVDGSILIVDRMPAG